MSMWKRFQGKIQGIHVDGDAESPPTEWWNHLYLALWGWKVVTVFEVTEEAAMSGYRIGYLPFDGKAMLESAMNHDRRFRMKIGHEACTFFAIAPDGTEAELKVVSRTMKDDVKHKDAPLH
jgi:hypothetical protein